MRNECVPLDLAPEMATLTTGTVNFGDEVFMNEPQAIEALAVRMKEKGQARTGVLRCWAHSERTSTCQTKYCRRTPLYFDFVMGVPGGIPGTVPDLMHCVNSLPPGTMWQVAGIGRAELQLAAVAIVLGGNVRVGFEDNIYYSRGVLAKSNAQLVARIARIAGELGRDVATPDEAREMLKLKK